MNLSFYSAAVGAGAQQEKLDVIANNMSNVNTTGFKYQNVGFVDLLYDNMNAPAGELTNQRSGSGTRVDKTDILFTPGAFMSTEHPLDYAIVGDGFFALMDPGTEEITYSRDGSFHESLFEDEEFYLVNVNGKFVLDQDMQPIVMAKAVYDEEGNLVVEETTTEEETETIKHHGIGVFTFAHKEGFIFAGNNEFSPVDKNGEPSLREDDCLKAGYLEASNSDLSLEMSKLIETQRAFQMALKMVQTSDEIEQVINSLR